MDVLKVHMFGEFQVFLNDQKLEFPGGIYSKTVRLLILLLYYGKEGVPRKKVLDILYGDSDAANESGNLRAISFRLKRQMMAAGLLTETDAINDHGVFRWAPETIDVNVDVRAFEKAADQALRLEKEKKGGSDAGLMSCLEDAYRLYTGEFLPALAAELWVAGIQAYDQETYFQCMRLYLRELSERGMFDRMLAVSREISRLYPYEEWFTAELDALISMNRWKEAQEAADQSTRTLMDKIGIHPSDEMMKRIREINIHIKGSSKGLLEIREELEEKQYEPGAFYCDYASFMGAYRYELRRIERSGQSLYLVLCTITEKDGSLALDDEDGRFENMVEELSSCIRLSLRRTDVYTRYGKNQFLIILVGLKQEDCPIAYARIERNFAKVLGSSRYRIHYFMVPVTSDFPQGKGRTIRFGSKMW